MWVTELPQKPKAPVISERMYNPCGEIPLGPRRLSKLHLYNNPFLMWRIKFWFGDVRQWEAEVNAELLREYELQQEKK